MRHPALAYLYIIFAPSLALGFCQEAGEPLAQPFAQEQEEKKNDPPKRDIGKTDPSGEESKRRIEELRREMGRLAQKISAAAIEAAKKNSVDNEDFAREIEALRSEMIKKAQEIATVAIAASKKGSPDEESRREIDNLQRDLGKMALDVSAKATRASDKIATDDEFRREMENFSREMSRMGQEIRVQAGQSGRAGGEAQSQASGTMLASARVLRLRGRYAEAAELYSQYIAKNPQSQRLFEARFWYAKSLFEDQKWNEAAAAFTDFLKNHPDQRTFFQVAKGDRIHCWKMQPKDPKAVASLKGALNDPDPDTRILAALALAENKIPDGRKVLEESVENPKFGEQCALALWKLGLRPQPKPKQGNAPWARLLVVKVKTDDDSFEIRVPLTFIKGIEKMIPEETRLEMERAGVPKIETLSEMAASAPKGTILFQYKNKENFVVISVE